MTSSVSSHGSQTHGTTSVISPATGGLPPATIVSYGDRHVKARIDRNVPLQEIIGQLCHSTQLQVHDPPALFALRDADTDELLTADNLARMLDRSARLKLCSSPVLEAAETVDKLSSRDEKLVKMAAHSLKGYVSEPTFVHEFLARGGLRELVGVIDRSTGNTLAYACTSLLTLMDVDAKWEGLDVGLIDRLCTIVTEQSLANVVRPATAILRKLVLADTAQTPAFGFQTSWSAMRHRPRCFQTIVSRLGAAASGDALLVQASLSLVNALFNRAIEERADDFLYEIERLDVRTAVVVRSR